MANTYSSSLRLIIQQDGTNQGTWGGYTNTNIASLIEQAITGVGAITVSGSSNYTLTVTNGASDEARNAVLNITGTLTAAINVICPTAAKTYIVKNGTTGGFAITVKTSAGTGISVPNGETTFLYCDGTNVVRSLSAISGIPGAFTTLSASGAVSGVGFSNYLASPPAIGGTAAAAGAFTTLAYTGTLTGSTGVMNIGSGQIYKDASGNLGIGTSSPSGWGSRLSVIGNGNQHGIYSQCTSVTASGYYGVVGLSGASSAYASGGVEGVSINENAYGILGYWSGSAYWSLYGNGSAYLTGTYQGSDERLKENIKSIVGSLGKIANLNPVSFNWKEKTDQHKNGLDADVGLIAQEVLPIFPDIVKEIDAHVTREGNEPTINEELGKFYTIEYTRLIPHLIAAVKELTARLETLEGK